MITYLFKFFLFFILSKPLAGRFLVLVNFFEEERLIGFCWSYSIVKYLSTIELIGPHSERDDFLFPI